MRVSWESTVRKRWESIRLSKYAQSSQHIAGRNAVDANASVSPLDGKRSSHVADSSLGGVVGTVMKANVSKVLSSSLGVVRSEAIEDVLCQRN